MSLERFFTCPLGAVRCRYNVIQYIDGSVQERRNSFASTLELWVSCTNPSISGYIILLPALRWQHRNINQSLNSWQTPHISPSWASIFEKIDHIIMTQHCFMTSLQHHYWSLVLGSTSVRHTHNIDGLVQERRNSIAYALELRLFLH